MIFLEKNIWIQLKKIYSNVPTVNDVLVPETLLKKQKSCAKVAEALAAEKAELRKVCIITQTNKQIH